MIRSNTIIIGGAATPPSFAQIFGANLFDDWDFGDSSYVTLVSGAVSQLTSKTGSGRDFLQATANKRPLLVTNQLNGKSVARFDGVNDGMQFTNTTSYQFLHQSQGCVIAIFKYDNTSVSGDDVRIFNTVTFSTGRGFLISKGPSPATTINNLVYKGSSGVILALNSKSITDLTWHSSVSVNDLANVTVADRMQTNFNNKGSIIVNGQNQPVSVGVHGNPTIGIATDLATYPLKGDIARIIVINRKPTGAELVMIQNRLLYEYGDFAN